MADFCQECSVEMFGEDHRELAGLCKGGPGGHVSALCEGCGPILVDENGKRTTEKVVVYRSVPGSGEAPPELANGLLGKRQWAANRVEQGKGHWGSTWAIQPVNCDFTVDEYDAVALQLGFLDRIGWDSVRLPPAPR